jgi:hypothetical protein
MPGQARAETEFLRILLSNLTEVEHSFHATKVNGTRRKP